MSFGLTDEALAQIIAVFKQHPEVQKVKIFGSRAMGNYRPNSDIDFAIMDPIDYRLLGTLYTELDDLPLPYLFDLLIENNLSNDALREHIRTHGKDIL